MVTVNPPPAGAPPAPPPHQLTIAGAPPLPVEAVLAGISEDALKKIRKPYTISKSRESWTEQEHDKFLEALQLFDRDWKKIEAFVGSKTVIQIRSHAQKYFLKVQKNGTTEHVPPPRPKRKAAHPYPQKASKNAGATVSSWALCSFPPVNALHIAKDIGAAGAAIGSCSSSIESPRGSWPACEATNPVNQVPSLRVMPDFTQVYNFLGNVFDPSTSGHLQKLKEMDPIDVETEFYLLMHMFTHFSPSYGTVCKFITKGYYCNLPFCFLYCVLLLMQNLSVNLNSPDFEDHRRTLSAYDTEIMDIKPGSPNNVFLASQAMNTPIA